MSSSSGEQGDDESSGRPHPLPPHRRFSSQQPAMVIQPLQTRNSTSPQLQGRWPTSNERHRNNAGRGFGRGRGMSDASGSSRGRGRSRGRGNENFNYQSRPSTPADQPPQPHEWADIRVNISNFPMNFNILKLHKLLVGYGHVNFITYRNKDAEVVFTFHRSALFHDSVVFDKNPLSIRLMDRRFEMMSLADGSSVKRNTVLPVKQLDFGILTAERRMMVMHTVTGSPEHPSFLRIDRHNGDDRKLSLDIFFFLSGDEGVPLYRLELRLSSPIKVTRLQNDDGRKSLVITSQFPPKYWRSVSGDHLEEIHKSSSDPSRFQDWPRGWRRVTDINRDSGKRDLNPVSFVQPDPIIDTGRWLTWKIDLPAGVGDEDYNSLIAILENRSVNIQKIAEHRFETVPRQEPVVWDLIDPHRASHESALHQMQEDMMHLSQDIRYQLEVCISTGKIIEHNISKDFIAQLGVMDKDFVRAPGVSITRGKDEAKSPALTLLENVAESKKTFFESMEIFRTPELRMPRRRRIPVGCVLMRTVTITPTTFYVRTPTVEVSNRVIRDNFVAESNFLRVKFEDEDTFGGLSPIAEYDNQHEVWERIERCLRRGIDISGRHYDWLACGNSQFRERGAYFFSPFDDQRTARSIRMGLGDFSLINVVAKCMARIGQCFSTTRASATIGSLRMGEDIRMIKDIERNGYCFTDGVGKISPFLAQMIANDLYARQGSLEYPSVFQYRLGGNKGILAVDPTLKNREIRLRPSQKKFDAPSVGLEIIKASRFSTSTLNQQLILVLTSRGIQKSVFVDKMKQELENINFAMRDEHTALNMLQKNVDVNQITISIAGMVLDGFMQSEEPFLQAIMQLWRAWNLKYLKEKAKLPIEKGAFVLGCVDETNTLRMDADDLPEIFIQIPGEKSGEWKTVQGVCLLARNPSLHPGDIQVVKAVEVLALKHLKNVVVLPQQGQRPLANMCSGGDLDGDDYLVMWDKDLLPGQEEWKCPPMNYDAPIPVMCNGPVQDEHFIKFFVDYIKHDNLGQIAVNHRAWADLNAAAGGVKHENCLALAQLHSQAVDFNKTGVPAIMDKCLWPTKYPHWIPGKPAKRQYHSKQVLGVLYDMVQPVGFSPLLDKPFDSRILGAYQLSEETLKQARSLKLTYDQWMRGAMCKYGIQTEFEIWTAFAMSHNREKHWYSLAEELGTLVSGTIAEFQKEVRRIVGLTDVYSSATDEAFDKLAPFVTAMYTVTAQEVNEWKDSKLVAISTENDHSPLISYPWMFARELGKIATRGERSFVIEKAHAAGLENVKRKAFTAKSSYQHELYSIELEPLAEWTLNGTDGRTTVGDHVGKAFDDGQNGMNGKEVSAGADRAEVTTNGVRTATESADETGEVTEAAENNETVAEDSETDDYHETSEDEEVHETPLARLEALMNS